MASSRRGSRCASRAARNQADALQHLEMLGERRLAHRERLGRLGHQYLTRREPAKPEPANWIFQSV